jgi:hypothetical protein
LLEGCSTEKLLTAKIAKVAKKRRAHSSGLDRIVFCYVVHEWCLVKKACGKNQ